MRKNYGIRLFILLLLTAFLSNTNAQSFERGAIVISAGTNLGIYNINFKTKTSAGKDTTTTSSTAALIYPVSVEVGLFNRLGLAAQFGYSKFIVSDSSKEAANGIDVVLKANFHIIKMDRIDVFVGADFGYAHFKYSSNDQSSVSETANGSDLDFTLGARFYLTKHFGIYVNLDIPDYNYKGVLSSDNSNSLDFSGKFTGVKLGGGLQLKF